MGMPRAIEKGKRVGPDGTAPGQPISSGTQKGNLGTSRQTPMPAQKRAVKGAVPNYKQKDPMVNLKQDV
jgi:hypothetical protein